MRRMTLLLMVWASLPALTDRALGASRPPNVVFVFGDDWGWGDLGCYGHRQLRTPHLDRLASEGVRFTQFYSCASVCSPSRTAWLTGQYPARHGMHGHLATVELNQKRGMPNYLDPRANSVARLFKSAGYATAHVGKWHLGASSDAPPVSAYGFDFTYSVLANGGEADPRSENFWAKSTGLFVDKTIEFIEANRERPFYVQTWLLDTHARLQPTPDQLDAYKGLIGATKIYYAAATNADRQIGRLLARIDGLNLRDNTIVIFSSDNGPEEILIGNASEHGVGSPGPFRGRKRSLYEGGIRMPFILRWPGHAPSGRVDNETVMCAADFLPTLCALTGANPPQARSGGNDGPPSDLDGENLLEAWRGRTVRRERPIMWEWRYSIFGHVINKSPILAMRDGPWKLLMNPDASRVELYDIPADPTELTNLADRKPDVAAAMSKRLLAWRKTLPESPHDPDAGRNHYPWPK